MKCPFVKDNCYGDECALYDDNQCIIVSMTNILDNIKTTLIMGEQSKGERVKY